MDRLATILVEKAMENLPHREQVIETPVGVETTGKTIDAEVSEFIVPNGDTC